MLWMRELGLAAPAVDASVRLFMETAEKPTSPCARPAPI